MQLLLGWGLWAIEVVVEHTATFFERLVAGIRLVDKMVECRIAGKIVVAMMVADRMALCFEKVDFGQYTLVELLLA